MEQKHCTVNSPQKEREVGFCYFTCVCVCEAVLHLKTKWHSKYTCSCSSINNSNKIYIGDKSFPISLLVEAFLSCPVQSQEVLSQHQPSWQTGHSLSVLDCISPKSAHLSRMDQAIPAEETCYNRIATTNLDIFLQVTRFMEKHHTWLFQRQIRKRPLMRQHKGKPEGEPRKAIP